MPDAAQIRAVVRRILADADLECSTQRSVQQQAEEELGMSLDPFKSIISVCVWGWNWGRAPCVGVWGRAGLGGVATCRGTACWRA